jgi:hypothetical protein
VSIQHGLIGLTCSSLFHARLKSLIGFVVNDVILPYYVLLTDMFIVLFVGRKTEENRTSNTCPKGLER